MSKPRRSAWKAGVLGMVIGALAGTVWGWIDYGAFDMRFFYNHVLGGALMLGALFFLIAALRNWMARNPM